MTVYSITTPDDQEDCITRARDAYNRSIPAEVPDPDNPGSTIPNPAIKADNAAYMQWVMENAVLSYCHQYFPFWPDRVPPGQNAEQQALDALVSENAIPLTPRNQELIAAILSN